MITPTPGIVYKFIFDEGYAAASGVFKLVQLMTYDEYLEAGRNLEVDFYSKCGKDSSDLERDIEKIRNSKIMKLVTPDALDTGNEVSYAPLLYLGQNPDHNVKRYHKLGIVAYVGITDDPSTLDFVRDNIQEQWQAALGITPDPKFMSTGDVYLTADDYQAVCADRNEDMRKVINYFSENKRLQKQLSQQKTQLAAYENLIKDLLTQVKSLQEQLGGGD